MTNRAYVPDMTVEQMCRLCSTSAELTRVAATLERALSQRQQRPTPFFGSVVADKIDIAALAARWGNEAKDRNLGANPLERRDAAALAHGEKASDLGQAHGAAGDTTSPAQRESNQAEPSPDQPQIAAPVAGAAPPPPTPAQPSGSGSGELAWHLRPANPVPDLPDFGGFGTHDTGIGAELETAA
jgi:hypothetical protein